MPVHNVEIADIFEEIADLLEIEDDNPFRIRAYRNAARTIRSLGRDVQALIEKGEDLTRLSGIGKDLAGQIQEVIDTGTTHTLRALKQEIPGGLADLLKIPGLGPKRVGIIYDELDIKSTDELYQAACKGRLRSLKGFGAKIEVKVRTAIEAHLQKKGRRIKLATAAEYAEPLIEYLAQTPGVLQAVVAGSYRRCKETVGDLDILVTAQEPGAVMDEFIGYDEVADVVSKGDTRSTVHLRSGLQVDLRVVAEDCHGAALYYFTGSRAHNIAVRRLAQKHGLKINEYGVFRKGKRIAGTTEESVFKAIGLRFIAPELRENRGEIEAARTDSLPTLVTLTDLKGDLHCHTKATDGRCDLQEMAQAAAAHGLSYLAITEHSKRLSVTHGLDQKRLLRQVDEIDRLNEKLTGIRVFKGIEVDILEDGGLDLPNGVLGRLDLVVGAVHSKFDLPRAKQTRRILKAMDHPHFTLLAHPSGRLIEAREAYEVDMAGVIRHARERGCYLELNAHPERLDLLDTYCQMAKDEGVLVAINSDAHSTLDFDNLRFGIGQARRGWLSKADVLNTRPLGQLRKLLKRTM